MPATATPLPLHEHLRCHARETPDRIAYLWYGQPITWAQLDAASDAFAARLQALAERLGEQERVVIDGRNVGGGVSHDELAFKRWDCDSS